VNLGPKESISPLRFVPVGQDDPSFHFPAVRERRLLRFQRVVRKEVLRAEAVLEERVQLLVPGVVVFALVRRRREELAEEDKDNLVSRGSDEFVNVVDERLERRKFDASVCEVILFPVGQVEKNPDVEETDPPDELIPHALVLGHAVAVVGA
jgi:hypothetical protein